MDMDGPPRYHTHEPAMNHSHEPTTKPKATTTRMNQPAATEKKAATHESGCVQLRGFSPAELPLSENAAVVKNHGLEASRERRGSGRSVTAGKPRAQQGESISWCLGLCLFWDPSRSEALEETEGWEPVEELGMVFFLRGTLLLVGLFQESQEETNRFGGVPLP